MKKIKQVALLFVVSLGLLSCETEKIEDVTNSAQGEPMVRFDLNGETRIVFQEDLYVYRTEDNMVTLLVTIRDEYSNFEADQIEIKFTTSTDPQIQTVIETGIYQTAFSSMDPQAPKLAKASFKYHYNNWAYSTENIYDDVQYSTQDRGTVEITNINSISSQIEGTFNFELFAPQGSGGEPNSIKIENGFFKYVNY